MSAIDYGISALYMACVLGVGFYHHRRNADAEDYFVGGRGMGAGHVGMSVEATDVVVGVALLGGLVGADLPWGLDISLLGILVSATVFAAMIRWRPGPDAC